MSTFGQGIFGGEFFGGDNITGGGASAATTMQDLVDQVRLRTDTVNSEFVADEELAGYLNSALGELYDLAVGKYEDYFISHVDKTIVSSDPLAGTNFFTLPDDFLKADGVDILIGGTWATMQRFSNAERNVYAFPLVVYPNGYVDLFYQVRGDNVYVIPATVASGYTYRLWYIPQCPSFDLTDTLLPTLDKNGWTEFAINDACSRVLTKQDMDPSAFESRKAAQQMRVLNAMASRDAGLPRHMVDTRSLANTRGWGGNGRYGP